MVEPATARPTHAKARSSRDGAGSDLAKRWEKDAPPIELRRGHGEELAIGEREEPRESPSLVLDN